jgi:hypothetical protein
MVLPTTANGHTEGIGTMYAIKLGNDYNGATVFATPKSTQTVTVANAFTTSDLDLASRKCRWILATVNRFAEVVAIR